MDAPLKAPKGPKRGRGGDLSRREPLPEPWPLRILRWWFAGSVHALGLWIGFFLWPTFLMLYWFWGIPSEENYSFRWHNSLFHGSSDEADPEEGAVFLNRPRRRRELPEMVKPRDNEIWDSRRFPFDEELGEPSRFETPFRTSSSSSGFQKAKGDSLDFVSDKPFRGKGTYDSLGTAGGGGGRYGSRIVLMDAVQLGLLWLARHQHEDGSWSERSMGLRCGRALPDGRKVSGPPCSSEDALDDVDRSTALAALAFSGARYGAETPHVWDGLAYRAVVDRACRFLSRDRPTPESRVLALLALTSFVRHRFDFEPPPDGQEGVPGTNRMRALLAAVEVDPPPPDRSDAAAWRALALLSATRARLAVSPESLAHAELELARRGVILPFLGPEQWPGDDLRESYLRLLASFEESAARNAALPREMEFRARLRIGQSREGNTCREGSWDPVGREGRLATTVLHLLALESLTGYEFRAGHPLRPAEED